MQRETMTSLGPDALLAAVQEPPTMQLNFYSYGIVLRKRTGEAAYTEYAVDPATIGEALAIRPHIDTGIIMPNTIWIGADGSHKTIVEFRPAQLTGIFLEGSEDALRIPMPPLLMIRTVAGKRPQYGVFAVKDRPTSLDVQLFSPPLPNMHTGGQICWGSVKRVPKKALESVDLSEDWRLYLGSQFNGHSAQGKSKKHPQDVRKMLIEVEQKKVKEYPLDDLRPDMKLNSFLAQMKGWR